jgi:hypothetical protein
VLCDRLDVGLRDHDLDHDCALDGVQVRQTKRKNRTVALKYRQREDHTRYTTIFVVQFWELYRFPWLDLLLVLVLVSYGPLGCGGREVCADNEIKGVPYFRHSENTEYIIFHSCNNNLEREGFFLL